MAYYQQLNNYQQSAPLSQQYSQMEANYSHKKFGPRSTAPYNPGSPPNQTNLDYVQGIKQVKSAQESRVINPAQRTSFIKSDGLFRPYALAAGNSKKRKINEIYEDSDSLQAKKFASSQSIHTTTMPAQPSLVNYSRAPQQQEHQFAVPAPPPPQAPQTPAVPQVYPQMQSQFLWTKQMLALMLHKQQEAMYMKQLMQIKYYNNTQYHPMAPVMGNGY